MPVGGASNYTKGKCVSLRIGSTQDNSFRGVFVRCDRLRIRCGRAITCADSNRNRRNIGVDRAVVCLERETIMAVEILPPAYKSN